MLLQIHDNLTCYFVVEDVCCFQEVYTYRVESDVSYYCHEGENLNSCV